MKTRSRKDCDYFCKKNTTRQRTKVALPHKLLIHCLHCLNTASTTQADYTMAYVLCMCLCTCINISEGALKKYSTLWDLGAVCWKSCGWVDGRTDPPPLGCYNYLLVMMWSLLSIRASFPHIFVFQSNQPKVGCLLEMRKHFRVKTSHTRGKQDGPSLKVQKLFCTVLWFLDIVHPSREQKSILELNKAVHCTAKFKKFKFHKRCDRAAKNQSLSFLAAFLSQNPCGQNQCQQILHDS